MPDETLTPMLARLARELPRDDFLYEPKWDGFRCLVFRDRDRIDLRSRHGRPLARYFPELVDAIRAIPTERLVLDGEIVVVADGVFDFGALMSRLHPARSLVERLSRESPASYVAFDLVERGAEDLQDAPFERRRERLERELRGVRPPLVLTPITDDVDTAQGWLERFQGAGIDGVVAKARDLPYVPGRRAMVKVKRDRTADCVVAGFRPFEGEPLVASLILGLYDGAALRHVGVASSFTDTYRREVFAMLQPLVVPLEGHPWEHGFNLPASPLGRLKGSAGRWDPSEMRLDWVPIRPERVAEIAYSQIDAGRFRHPARFRRWRPDREPSSCTFDQLAIDAAGVGELLAAS